MAKKRDRVAMLIIIRENYSRPSFTSCWKSNLLKVFKLKALGQWQACPATLSTLMRI